MMLSSFLKKVSLLTLLLVFCNKIYAEIEIDPEQCQFLYPHIAFKGKKKFKLPRYMEDMHLAYDQGTLQIPEHIEDYHAKKIHPDCDTFNCFLGFVFLCAKQNQGLYREELFSESNLDIMIRNIALSGCHQQIVYWYDIQNPNMIPGAKLIWYSDNGPENASVKWLGVLEPDQSLEITIGVEFENPIGSGTGKYKEKQLFKTEQDHASLMPVLGLMGLEAQHEASNKQLALMSIDDALPSISANKNTRFSGQSVMQVQLQKFEKTGAMEEIETDGFKSFVENPGKLRKPDELPGAMFSYVPWVREPLTTSRDKQQTQSLPTTEKNKEG